MYSRCNRGYCKHQEDSHCIWIPKTGDTEKHLAHICSFVLPCCGMLCGSKEHSAVEHKFLPAHCWMCYNTEAKKIKVNFCLRGYQWQNGAAEQRVRALKDALDLTIPNGSVYFDFSEFRTLLVKCADLINSRPIGVTLIVEDLQLLTPNHLLIGRAQSGQVSQEVLI